VIRRWIGGGGRETNRRERPRSLFAQRLWRQKRRRGMRFAKCERGVEAIEGKRESKKIREEKRDMEYDASKATDRQTITPEAFWENTKVRGDRKYS